MKKYSHANAVYASGVCSGCSNIKRNSFLNGTEYQEVHQGLTKNRFSILNNFFTRGWRYLDCVPNIAFEFMGGGMVQLYSL